MAAVDDEDWLTNDNQMFFTEKDMKGFDEKLDAASTNTKRDYNHESCDNTCCSERYRKEKLRN